ncbi:protein PIN-LIKES 3-like [Gossypium australe]|uniref:Protein PIN-LIKES 3-like n=1 Tax=Gossypium australe TaxID=47621 RepID=A0A5B6UBF4_9ROSI|nr:protein PIN-LIKES 3-like [Gossypium australe]
MELLRLFITSVIPVIKVLLVLAIGSFLATESVDLLGPNARHHLNNLVFYVFLPALVGCSIADTITVKSLETLWFMPVNICISCIIGSVLGFILIKITKTPPHLKGLVIACSSAANLGNMLTIILPALCEETNSPFGDSSTCSEYGLAYASLSLAVSSVLLLLHECVNEEMQNKYRGSKDLDLTFEMLNLLHEHKSLKIIRNERKGNQCNSYTNDLMQAIYVWSILYSIMRASANSIVKETAEILSETPAEPLLVSHGSSEDNIYQVDLPDEGNERMSTFGKMKQCFMTAIRSKSLKMIFAPTTIAAIVGFIVGIVSPFRKVLVDDSAPFHVIYSSIELIGEAGIPSMTLVVGANLLKGLKGSAVKTSLLVGILIIRNILLPVSGVVVVKAAMHFGLVGSYSLYQFTLLLQYAIPPAMNIGTILQMLGTGEAEFSVLMLWNYVVAAFSLTLWTAFYMWLVT